MFEKRCTLCGGKLNSNGICAKCGLDNNKIVENYKTNQNENGHETLTYVHHDKNEKLKKQPKRQKSGNGVGKILKNVGQLIWDDVFEEAYYSRWKKKASAARSNPYANLEEELPEEGESVNCELLSGDYIVGVHIPEGKYQAVVSNSFDSIEVDDEKHGIDLYEYVDRFDGNYLDDLRLYAGAIVRIFSASGMTLCSENAQTKNLSYQKNPMAGLPAVILKESAMVGVDIGEGVYDVAVVNGTGNLVISIRDEEDEEDDELRELELGEEKEEGTRYQNLVLPKHAKLTIDGDLKLSFTPSEKIAKMDYSNYYDC